MANAAKFAAPQYYEDFSPVVPPTLGVGAVAGLGAYAGKKIGGLRGAIAGGIIGGGMAAASYGKLAMNRGEQGLRTPYAGDRTLNRETFDYDIEASNPGARSRNSSLANAQMLNSTGDIVLGMHNMRRG
jgi:hypothetical protein